MAASGSEGSARVTHYEHTYVEIDTERSDVGCCPGDLDYPGWRATVDGAPVRIHRAIAVCAAVALPPDAIGWRSRSSRSPSVLGAWLSLAGAGGHRVALPATCRGSTPTPG